MNTNTTTPYEYWDYEPSFTDLKFKTNPTYVGEIIDNTLFYRFFDYLRFEDISNPMNYKQINNNIIRDYIEIENNTFEIPEHLQIIATLKNIPFLKEQVFCNKIILHRPNKSILINTIETMYLQLKRELHNLSPFKTELDIIYTELIKQSGHFNYNNFNLVDQLEKQLKQRSNEVDKQLNKYIFGSVIEQMNTFKKPKIYKTTAEKKVDNAEKEFNEYVQYKVENGKYEFKLSTTNLKRLDKKSTDKFILPLYASELEDINKFEKLTDQPFNFLEYNGAKFSIIFNISKKSEYYKTNQDKIESDIGNSFDRLDTIKSEVNEKQKHFEKRIEKLKNVEDILEKHVTHMKENITQKVDKYKNERYITFIAKRTLNNIEKVREAQRFNAGKLNAFQNKLLKNNKEMFFKRYLYLSVGKTGSDILKDLTELNLLKTQKDFEQAIVYLRFLLIIIQDNIIENKGFFLPTVTISKYHPKTKDRLKNFKILRVMAGHMFINLKIVNNKNLPPKAPEPREIKE